LNVEKTRPIPTPVLSGSGSKGPSEDVSGHSLPLGMSLIKQPQLFYIVFFL